jgi:hypothetical protein
MHSSFEPLLKDMWERYVPLQFIDTTLNEGFSDPVC